MTLADNGIAYDRAGPQGGPAVLLLHAGVADRRMWDAVWDSLIPSRNVIRLDLRGFGESERLPDGPLSYPADVLALLDELAVGRCDVIAASMGSGVAMEVAIVAPDRVRSLALCPPGGSLLATRTPDLAAFAEAESSALAAGDLDAAVAANIATWVVGPGRDPGAVDPSVRDAVARMQRRAFEVGAAFDDIEEDELEPPALKRLTEVAAPVLVLLGGFDLETTREATERLVAGLPAVRRVDWADAAHLPSMEHPERFTALVLDWLERPTP